MEQSFFISCGREKDHSKGPSSAVSAEERFSAKKEFKLNSSICSV
jgi:hypothetical protein